jgi:hypothetical protein
VTTQDVKQLTGASDVYSMGCVGLYVCIFIGLPCILITLQFIFLQIPYAHGENNDLGDIFRDIMDGIPPATKPTVISTEFNQVWIVLERCWGTTPDTRPTAPSVLESLNTRYNIEFPSTPHKSPSEELLVEGRNLYALHQPRLPKALQVELVYEFNLHPLFVKYIRYFLVMVLDRSPQTP